MNPKKVTWSVVALFAFAAPSFAGPIGDVQVVYNAPNTWNLQGAFNATHGAVGILDGPAFRIDNLSGTDMTNVVFNANGDSFAVGTIAANSYVVVVPGFSNDGGAGHTFFAFLGGVLDTSDVGPAGNNVPFSVTGQQGAVQLTTGQFTPDATKGPTNDGAIAVMNFLGGPGNNDGPCSDCFGPKVVADINPVPTGVPEPASIVLLASGGLGMAAGWCRRKRPERKCAAGH
jgi:hypothetical protein